MLLRFDRNMISACEQLRCYDIGYVPIKPGISLIRAIEANIDCITVECNNPWCAVSSRGLWCALKSPFIYTTSKT